MLNPDQSRLRISEKENYRLRKDNDRLRQKLYDLAQGMCAIVDSGCLPSRVASAMKASADEMKAMKLEDF